MTALQPRRVRWNLIPGRTLRLLVRQADGQVRKHPYHSHMRTKTNKTVNREVIARCRTFAQASMQEQRKRKGNNLSTRTNSKIFDSVDSEPAMPVQIIALHAAVDFFFSITAQS